LGKGRGSGKQCKLKSKKLKYAHLLPNINMLNCGQPTLTGQP